MRRRAVRWPSNSRRFAGRFGGDHSNLCPPRSPRHRVLRHRAPSEAETRSKIDRITGSGWPFLVATIDGEVAAYAYVTQLRDRAAYRFTCENSIYVRHDRTGRGIGKRLLESLCERSAAIGFRQMIAVIGGAEPASIALHGALGFEEVGRLRSVGWKKERWLDTVYMQRDLAAPDI